MKDNFDLVMSNPEFNWKVWDEAFKDLPSVPPSTPPLK